MGSVMCGRRGAVGSATAENVLAGKTFSSDKGVNIAGTMPDRGQWQYGRSLVHVNGYYAMNQLPEGYYHADGADWAPEIRISVDDAKKTQMWKDAYNAGYNAGFANGKAQPKTTTLNVGYNKAGDWFAIRINGNQVVSKRYGDYPEGVHDGVAYYNVTV